LERGIGDPVEILRCAQHFLLIGRPLDIANPSEALQGKLDSSFLTGTMSFKALREKNPRLTLEVCFYGEGAVDAGGRRREFFRLRLQQIKIMVERNTCLMIMTLLAL